MECKTCKCTCNNVHKPFDWGFLVVTDGGVLVSILIDLLGNSTYCPGRCVVVPGVTEIEAVLEEALLFLGKGGGSLPWGGDLDGEGLGDLEYGAGLGGTYRNNGGINNNERTILLRIISYIIT